ncbi:MAG: glutamate-1-semialdehyde 2,1-aminomutase [Planctomycetes bacterium]|nr:glutamate-1-semialdehyde 2,1-aminomutase [Planctomycetota bacterium]
MTASSADFFAQARQLMPGGVNSPVRAFRSVGGTPRFIDRAKGCHLFDVEGRKYIDYIGSWGPMIVGHAHPEVCEALEQTLRRGTSFGTPSPLEVELAREIIDRVPSIEMVRMVNSGTEAVMSALRLARAVTGRNKFIKFDGCYHGHADAFLVRAGSGVATLGLPDSPGVTPGATADTLVAGFNDLESVEAIFRDGGSEIAAVIVEPVAGNMGVVPPQPGFLEGLRSITQEHGALLIFDEVMTGFRVARGGAQELFGVQPDITTLGKIIGGGLPVGAYGGSSRIMAQIAPMGPVYQAGTLSGNPLAMAAGLATLRMLDQQAYLNLEQRSAKLADELERLLAGAKVSACVQRVGSMLTLFFGRQSVSDFSEARAADHNHFARFFQAMLQEGVHLPPSGYEAWFVSLAHDDGAIDHTLACTQRALCTTAGA